MKKYKSAFTLTEILVSLSIIGVVVAILIPIISGLMPNQNVIMAKKTFFTIQSMVSDIINDEACYPDLTSAPDDKMRFGLDDGKGYAECSEWDADASGSPNEKFATIFAKKLSGDNYTIDDSSVSYDLIKKDDYGNALESDDLDYNMVLAPGATPYEFNTDDGVTWKIKNSGFQAGKNTYTYITVDVNGSAKEPNCGQVSQSTVCSSSKKNYDKYTVKLYSTGRIEVMDSWAQEAIKVTKDNTGR